MLSENFLTRLLYTYDPAHTHCALYKQFDEYSAESFAIIDLLNRGIPFKLAFYSVMSQWFWDGWLDVFAFQCIELEYYFHTL